jgi:hypothetical protein
LFSDRFRFFAKWEGPVTAVASWRLPAEQGKQALSPFRAATIVSDLDRPVSDNLRIVAALYEAATGSEFHPQGNASGASMVATVGAAAREGRLLLFAGWQLDGAALGGEGTPELEETVEEELIREVMGGLSRLDFEGRRYRFILARRWPELSRQAPYGIVPLVEARAVVERMAHRRAPNPSDKIPWNELAELLSDRPDADAVLLLRDRPSGGVAPQPAGGGAPAVTPSKVVPVAEKTWVEIHVTYDDGTPFDGNCCVELPDGRKTEGTPDKNGIVRIEGLDPGSCKVSFPHLDASGWKPA